MADLPLPGAELAARLSTPLATRRDGWALTVTGVSLSDLGDDDVTIALTVRCRAHATSPEETWQVAIPIAREDLDGSMTTAAFVVTVRANLEEWWDTRGYEPHIRDWGKRVQQN